jgi:hypothetical protein
MSGYLQYSNYGDEDGTPAVSNKPPQPPPMVQQKRTLRTNQRTLRSKQSLQRNQYPNQPSQQPPPQQQQHKYVQELIQNIHSYENGGNANDSDDEDEDNNYVPPLSNNSNPISNSRSNAIHQQFQTEAVPNRNRFTGATSTDLNAKYNPAPTTEAFTLQLHDAKALASKYMPSDSHASDGSATDVAANKDILLQKLDHIISLLEDQQDEKTGHVTEELVLYCFLGVFIIFIVDSFARAGKYVR